MSASVASAIFLRSPNAPSKGANGDRRRSCEGFDVFARRSYARNEAATIAKQLFGRTGHQSTRTIFGAAALSAVTQDEADQTLEVLLHHGVNHIDVAAGYGDAELRIAPWLQKHPGRFFLATKTGGRTYDEAKRDIHNSLERMGVERVDLIQLHSLADPIEWDIALSPKGALDACVEAREQGLVRFIGVTGHGSQIAATHLRSLERFDFDSVLLPYSYITMQDPHYAAAFNRVVALCSERDVAVQTIKSIARRPWWGRDHTHATCYEPFADQGDIDIAVHWVLARPGIFVSTVGDIYLLPKVLDAASRFASAPNDEALREQSARLEVISLFV
jgi:predicted aldo/keto reductase-like oxidoreductase